MPDFAIFLAGVATGVVGVVACFLLIMWALLTIPDDVEAEDG